jgi:cytochrome c oxidase subunit II
MTSSYKTAGLILASAILLSACASSSPPSASNTPTNPPAAAAAADVTGNPVSANIKTFNMTAKQFTYSPDTITVNQGDNVVINLTSADVAHGFELPDFNASGKVEAGQTTAITFTADKKGTFTFKCNVPCGPGHKEMTGTLVVQ